MPRLKSMKSENFILYVFTCIWIPYIIQYTSNLYNMYVICMVDCWCNLLTFEFCFKTQLLWYFDTRSNKSLITYVNIRFNIARNELLFRTLVLVQYLCFPLHPLLFFFQAQSTNAMNACLTKEVSLKRNHSWLEKHTRIFAFLNHLYRFNSNTASAVWPKRYTYICIHILYVW